jgi:hypothetical protein
MVLGKSVKGEESELAAAPTLMTRKKKRILEPSTS